MYSDTINAFWLCKWFSKFNQRNNMANRSNISLPFNNFANITWETFCSIFFFVFFLYFSISSYSRASWRLSVYLPSPKLNYISLSDFSSYMKQFIWCANEVCKIRLVCITIEIHRTMSHSESLMMFIFAVWWQDNVLVEKH